MCGIAGIYNHDDAAVWTAEALFAQQHRGQDSCGLTSTDGARLYRHRGMGMVREVLAPRELVRLPGRSAVGHVRYPTQGAAVVENAQPHLFVRGGEALFSVSSNGDITNLPELRWGIESRGYTLEGTNDAEVIAKSIGIWAYEDGDGLERAIQRWLQTGRGAYSTVLLTPRYLYAFRDPNGFRPMCLGELNGASVVASETVALDTLRAKLVGQVEPGSVLRFGPEGMVRLPGVASEAKHHCIFELIYFSRPDSRIFDERVFEVRRRIGEALAEGDATEGDLVMPIPDSSNYMALAYAKARNLPYEMGLVRNHYVGRTFIAPEQRVRDESVRLKFNPLPGVMEGKRLFVVDDSIVRGTTIKKLINMLRENGAKEVHLRIGSPAIRHSCYYGIDTPEQDKLIAFGRSEEEVAQLLGADSLRYLSLEKLQTTVSKRDDYCYACFNGNYPAGKKEEEL